MLEQFNDLISTICTNSSIVQEVREDRYFFTDDGSIYDSLWKFGGYYKFATTERLSYGGAHLWTRNPIVAKYELTIILGNCVRRANSWKPIALPAETNAIQKAWSLTPLPNSTAVECTFEDNPDFTFGTLETERWLPLAKLMSMNLDDAIQLYLTE